MINRSTKKRTRPRRIETAVLAVMVLAGISCHGCWTEEAGTEREDAVLVHLGQRDKIMWSEFEYLIRSMPPKAQEALKSQSELLNRLWTMVDGRVLALSAKDHGLDRDPKIRARLADYELSQLSSLMMRDLERRYQEQKQPVTDEDIQNYYQENIHFYTEGEQFGLNKIGVISLNGWDAKRKIAARERIEKAKALLRAGESFAKVAEEYSSDGSKKRGGDIGYWSRSQMPAWMLKGMKELNQSGDISSILESENGYAIIQLRDKRSSYVHPIDEVRDDIRGAIERDRRSSFFDTELKALHDEYVQTVDNETIATLHPRDESRDDQVLVSLLGGGSITVGDFRQEMENRIQYRPVTELSLKERHDIADAVIEKHVMAYAAHQKGLDQSPEFAMQMKFFETQILSGAEQNRIYDEVEFNPTDAELRRYYDQNKAYYVEVMTGADGQPGDYQPYDSVVEQTYQRMANQVRAGHLKEALQKMKDQIGIVIESDVFDERAPRLLEQLHVSESADAKH